MQRSRSRAATLVGNVDSWLLLAFLALVGTGVLMVYSSSIADSLQYYGSPYWIFEHEVVWAALGFAALATTALINYRHWERFALVFLGGTIFLLMIVLV